MLILQEFKKAVTEQVLETLLRSGQLPCGFFALGEDSTGKSYVYRRVMAVDQFIREDGQRVSYGYQECAEEMRNNPQLQISCLAYPQYLLRFHKQGKEQRVYLPYIYNQKGEILHHINELQQEADNAYLTISTVLTLTYEYPIGEQSNSSTYYVMGLGQQPLPAQRILGCTQQVICCAPHAIIGLKYTQCFEHGTEYGEAMSPNLLGRQFQRGVLVENTNYVGQSPWTLGTDDAIAIWQGSKTRIPLPQSTK